MTKKHKKNSIWNRLKRSFVLILCLPILGLGSYMFYSTIRFVKEERDLEISKLIEQNIVDLNNRMEQCENSLIYVTSNYTLQEFLQMDESDYFNVSQVSRTVAPLLYNVLLSNQYYQDIEVYTDKQFSVMSDLLKDISKVEEEYWYKDTINTADICWWYDDGDIFLTRRIVTAYPVKTIGVIRVEVKRKLLQESFQIFENVPVKITLNGEEELYTDSSWKDGFYTKNQQLLPENWFLKYEINSQYFYPHTGMTFVFPMGVISIVLIAAGVVIWFILKRLVKEVDYLVEKVEEVKMGNLDIQIQEVQTDELNILAASMNEMLERIRQLIQKVYQTEIEQKELELEVLRSKISPHFLYNNLSAINWLAIQNEQDDIYEITTQMAAFYRTALNKGKKLDALRLEIMNIEAYIKLQLISHEYSFDVVYDIDETVLEYIVPTFILQPLVENAIEHGIDLLRNTRGRIIIRAFQRDKLLHLQVEDNGIALYMEIGNSMLEKERFGYGTGNVNRRIQLVHGEEYGLEIYASEKGTLAELKLKIDDKGITSAVQQERM